MYFCAFLFSVHNVRKNYDLNPKFEQKNFKNEDGTSNSISKKKNGGKQKREKINKKLIHQKNQEGYYLTYLRPNLYLKSGKPIFLKKREKAGKMLCFLFFTF